MGVCSDFAIDCIVAPDSGLRRHHFRGKPLLRLFAGALVWPGFLSLFLITDAQADLREVQLIAAFETWEEAFFLRAAGDDYGQGWFWSKAVAAPEATQMLVRNMPI